ncbi:MAG: glutathione S-transferase family protein [Rhizobiales bacterium]|nr:glutathione S-transferase family protein [Hyphomicrobiales bacterium]
MTTEKLTLISHHLCPYVQRAAISLTEKNVPFDRINIDLANKPDWFLKISPLGKTPVLLVGDTAIFESAVILEYLEDAMPKPLHPTDPLERALHRSWIEFGSSVLNDIGGFYSAATPEILQEKTDRLASKFEQLEHRLGQGPWFAGENFSLPDAAFGPVFRYFDVFDKIADFGILANKPKISNWRKQLNQRPSIRDAVTPDYETRLSIFLEARNSALTKLMESQLATA